MDTDAYIACVAVLAFCISMSNLVVLMVIIKCEHLHIPNNMFVAGMALADASAGVIALALNILEFCYLQLDYNICLVINCVYLYIFDVSCYMLVGFTLDRLYAIRFPFRYHQNVDCKDAIIVISVVWTLGIVVALIPFMIIEDEMLIKYPGICSFRAVMPPDYLKHVRFYIYIVELLMLIIGNTYIWCVVGRHRRNIKKSLRQNSGEGRGVRKKDVKAEKMLICMITTFLVCGLPINIINLEWDFSDRPDPIFLHVMVIIYYLNSLLNPFIYAVSNKRIKRACKNVILCRPLNGTITESLTIGPTTRGSKSSRKSSSKSSRKSNCSIKKGSKGSSAGESKGTRKTESATPYFMNILLEMTTKSWSESREESNSVVGIKSLVESVNTESDILPKTSTS